MSSITFILVFLLVKNKLSVMSATTYYCYNCQDTVPLRNSDLICDLCGGEFIEETAVSFPRLRSTAGHSHLGHGHAHAHDAQNRNANGHGHAHGHLHADGGNQGIAAQLQQIMRAVFGGGPNASGDNAQASASASDSTNQGEERPQQPPNIPGIPQDFAEMLSTALGHGLANNGNTIRIRMPEGGAGAFDLGNGVSLQFQMGGQAPPGGMNVGDYAFGNMDRIITDLMNRVDAEGVRGVNENDLKNIPMISVTQEHVDKETQCSTCFDNFVLDEPVAQIGCMHIFHRNCLEPWLKQHITCPVCREEVKPSEWTAHKAPPNGMVDDTELD